MEARPGDEDASKAEQLVEVPEIVSRDGVQQRTVEQIIDAPVPQAVEELAEVSKVSSKDGIQQRIVEQTIPAIPLAEKIVELLFSDGRNDATRCEHACSTRRQRSRSGEVRNHRGDRQKPIIQEKIDQGTKHFEIPKLQFTDKVVHVPVVAQKQISMNLTVQKNIEISQLQVDDKMVDVPAMLVVPVPQVRIVKKTVEDSQLQIVEKTIENPETQISEVVTDACLTCDVKCKVACLTCVKDNMFMVAGEITVARKTRGQVDVERVRQHTGAAALQRQPHSTKQQPTEQTAQEREGEKKMRGQVEKEKGQGERERGERRKEEEETGEKGKEVQEETDDEVEKDVTDWVEVRRRTRRKRRKMIQIFVKVNGGKTSAVEVEMSDRVDDIVKKTPISDQDVYVTSGGRILKRSDKLKSCEVRDGSTIQVMSRTRGGGKHKDKKSKVDKKQAASAKTPEQKFTDKEDGDRGPAILENEKEAIIRMWEENEASRKLMDVIPEGSGVEMEQALQSNRTAGREVLGWDQGQADMMECGLRWAVEARRMSNGGNESKGSRNKASKASKWILAMRNRRERKAQTSRRRWVDWRKYGQAEEVQASSEGEMRDAGRTRPAKGKEKGMEERVSMKAKEEDLGTAGNSKR